MPPQTFGPTGFVDLGATFPERSQYGARWNVVGPGFEASVSYFDGFNHLPQYTATPLSSRPLIALQRTYAPLRMAGADAAVPLRWFTVKGEAAVALHDQQRTPTMWSCTSFSSSGSRAS